MTEGPWRKGGYASSTTPPTSLPKVDTGPAPGAKAKDAHDIGVENAVQYLTRLGYVVLDPAHPETTEEREERHAYERDFSSTGRRVGKTAFGEAWKAERLAEGETVTVVRHTDTAYGTAEVRTLTPEAQAKGYTVHEDDHGVYVAPPKGMRYPRLGTDESGLQTKDDKAGIPNPDLHVGGSDNSITAAGGWCAPSTSLFDFWKPLTPEEQQIRATREHTLALIASTRALKAHTKELRKARKARR